MKNVDYSEKEKSKEKVNRIIYGSISSSLITYIIVMTGLAMAFGFVTDGFTMYQLTANNFDYDEAIFIFLCLFV